METMIGSEKIIREDERINTGRGVYHGIRSYARCTILFREFFAVVARMESNDL